MKKLIAFVALALVSLSFAGIALAAEGTPGEQQGVSAPTWFDSPQAVGTKATCPVTGEVFTINSETTHSEYKGKHVYFCCSTCKPKFDRDPGKYLK